MSFCLSSKYIDKQIMIVKKPNNKGTRRRTRFDALEHDMVIKSLVRSQGFIAFYTKMNQED